MSHNLAFTSPDGVPGSQVELEKSNGAPLLGALVPVAQLHEGQQLQGNDGTPSPLVLTLLAAGHEAGLYLWSQYLNVVVPAGASVDIVLSFADLNGPQTSSFLGVALAGPGIADLGSRAIFSAGTAPIAVTLTFAGATGAPLSLDYVSSVALMG